MVAMPYNPNDFLFPGLGDSTGPFGGIPTTSNIPMAGAVGSNTSAVSPIASVAVPSIAAAAGGIGGGGIARAIAGGGAGGGGILGGIGVPQLQLGLAGLQTIGNLWGAWQAAKLAKKQFNFTKDITETNLANSIKSYNTALSDRARSRGVVEGQSASQVQQYVDENSARRG